MSPLEEHITQGHARGWSFTPLGGSDGKKPLLEGWSTAARESLEQALAWARAGNVGLRTGSISGVVVIDIDAGGSVDPLALPPTVTAITGSGNRHLYFACTSAMGNTKGKLAPHVDTRGDGGQVVFPGSINPATGGVYRWAEGLSPEQVVLAPLPRKIVVWYLSSRKGKTVRQIADELGIGVASVHRDLTAMRGTPAEQGAEREAQNGTDCSVPRCSDPLGDIARAAVPRGTGAEHEDSWRGTDPCSAEQKAEQRGTELDVPPPPTFACSGIEKRCMAYLARCPDAISGQGGHDATFRAACECWRFGLDPAAASRVMAWFNNAKCHPAWSEKELEHKLKTARAAVGAEFGSRNSSTPPADTPPAAHAPDYVLIPGAHTDEEGRYFEVSEDQFANDVISRLPNGSLYRRDLRPGELIGTTGQLRFDPIEPGRLPTLISSHMRFRRWHQITRGPRAGQSVLELADTRPHTGLVFHKLHLAASIPEIRMLVSHPLFLPDWTLARPGYNEGGIYYDRPRELADLRPEDDPETIRCTLDELVVDFPFKCEADRQNFFGLLLTPLIRAAIGGNAPLHLVMAPLERTGKSLLVEQVVGRVLLGHPLAAMQLPRAEDERDKRILSLLLSGQVLWHLDNLGEFVDSPALASLLTANVYQGRILGESRMLSVPNFATVVATGNNVRATGEIVKRTVPICLQPPSSNPEERTDFVHPDLEKYVAQVRFRVLECLLGLVEVWIAAGKPQHRLQLGGFNAWSRTVGGVLSTMGWNDWRGNERRWRRDADPEGEDLRMLVEAWWNSNGQVPMTVREIIKLADEIGAFSHLLARSNSKAQETAFGRMLSSRIDTPVGQWIMRRRDYGSASTYRLDQNITAEGENTRGGA